MQGPGSPVWRARLAGLLAAILIGCLAAAPVAAAPAADLWPRWLAHDPDATHTIDHSPWAQFLSRYLVQGEDGINRMRYGAVNGADRQALAAYIDGLAALPISRYSRDEQFAYWANLYNALTVRVILAHYPVDSVRDINISPGLFTRGPWGARLVTIEGQAVSLDDIEHRIMRPIWQDPRIHYMVNCAALGCPNLAPEPYLPDRLEAMLDQAARAFVNHPRGARMTGGGLRLSSIYRWYREDFGDSDAAVLGHLRVYAEGALARALQTVTAIDGHDYDWTLNAAKPDS